MWVVAIKGEKWKVLRPFWRCCMSKSFETHSKITRICYGSFCQNYFYQRLSSMIEQLETNIFHNYRSTSLFLEIHCYHGKLDIMFHCSFCHPSPLKKANILLFSQYLAHIARRDCVETSANFRYVLKDYSFEPLMWNLSQDNLHWEGKCLYFRLLCKGRN